MQKAGDLIEAYVRAGFVKIHLDASMHLAGDPGERTRPLADEIVARRAAPICAPGPRRPGSGTISRMTPGRRSTSSAPRCPYPEEPRPGTNGRK